MINACGIRIDRTRVTERHRAVYLNEIQDTEEAWSLHRNCGIEKNTHVSLPNQANMLLGKSIEQMLESVE